MAFPFRPRTAKMFGSALYVLTPTMAVHTVALEAKLLYVNDIWDNVETISNESLQNKLDYARLLQGCLVKKSLSEAKKLHAHMIYTGFNPDVSMSNKLLSIYAKFGSLEDARQVFDSMPQRDVISWTTIIAAYARRGICEYAIELYYEMQGMGIQPSQFTFAGVLPAFANFGDLQKGKEIHQDIIWSGFQSNVFVGSALVDMYMKCKSMEDARDVFEKMPERNVVSWTAMITGYVQAESFGEALDLFCQMQSSGVRPDAGVLSSVLPACAHLARLQQGREVHDYIISNGFQFDVFVASAVVDMYAKCGSIEDARKVFDKVPRQDVVSWTAMIVGYAVHGCSKDALQLFEQMGRSGIKPNRVTFLGVLSACCHAGLVEDGFRFFHNMSTEYDIMASVDHYCCMVDLLGRAGRLDEAEQLVKKMPIKPNVAVWRSLLGACRIHGNTKLGEWAAEQLINLDSQSAANYVLLSNIYATAGKWDGIQRVRKMMKDNKVKKSPACSWIEVNNKVHTFLMEEMG